MTSAQFLFLRVVAPVRPIGAGVLAVLLPSHSYEEPPAFRAFQDTRRALAGQQEQQRQEKARPDRAADSQCPLFRGRADDVGDAMLSGKGRIV